MSRLLPPSSSILFIQLRFPCAHPSLQQEGCSLWCLLVFLARFGGMGKPPHVRHCCPAPHVPMAVCPTLLSAGDPSFLEGKSPGKGKRTWCCAAPMSCPQHRAVCPPMAAARRSPGSDRVAVSASCTECHHPRWEQCHLLHYCPKSVVCIHVWMCLCWEPDNEIWGCRGDDRCGFSSIVSIAASGRSVNCPVINGLLWSHS